MSSNGHSHATLKTQIQKPTGPAFRVRLPATTALQKSLLKEPVVARQSDRRHQIQKRNRPEIRFSLSRESRVGLTCGNFHLRT